MIKINEADKLGNCSPTLVTRRAAFDLLVSHLCPSLPPSLPSSRPPSRCQTTSSHLVAKDLGSVPPSGRCRLRGCAAAAGSPPNAPPALRTSVFYVCVITSRSSAGDRDDGVSSDSDAALRGKKKKKRCPISIKVETGARGVHAWGHDTAQRTDKLEWKTDGRSVSVRTDGLTDSQRRARTDCVHISHFWQTRRLRTRAGSNWAADLSSSCPAFLCFFFFFFVNHRDPDVKEFKLAGSHYRATMSPRRLPVYRS